MNIVENVGEYSNLMSYLGVLAKGDKQELEKIQRFKPLLERSVLRSMSKISSRKNEFNKTNKKIEEESLSKISPRTNYKEISCDSSLDSNNIKIKTVLKQSNKKTSSRNETKILNEDKTKSEKKQVSLVLPLTKSESHKKLTKPQKLKLETTRNTLGIRPTTCKNQNINTFNFLNKESYPSLDNVLSPAHKVSNLFLKCHQNENQAKKLNKAITKIHHTKNKSFKNKLEKKIRQMNSTGYDDVKKVLSGSSNFTKDRNYLIFRDYENKTKIVSQNKNNIYEKLNFVKHITPTTAFEMKDHLNNLFLKNTNKTKIFSLSRPKTSFERPIKKEINFGEINKNHSKIKQIISDTQILKNRIYKLENIVG
jgi:hypothetical protein